jgi:hypothetical protein
MIVLIGKSGYNHVYHTESDCENISGETRQVERHKLEPFYEECEVCSQGTFTNEDQSKDCMYCGESVHSIAYHLPECPEL